MLAYSSQLIPHYTKDKMTKIEVMFSYFDTDMNYNDPANLSSQILSYDVSGYLMQTQPNYYQNDMLDNQGFQFTLHVQDSDVSTVIGLINTYFTSYTPLYPTIVHTFAALS